MSDTFNFPGAFVYRRTLPNHEEVKARLLPSILEKAKQEAENPDWGWSSESPSTVRSNWNVKDQIFEFFTREDIEDIIFSSLRSMLEEVPNLGRVAQSYNLKDMWWNRYPPGATAPPHVHDGSVSGVYFLEQTEPSPLRFLYVNAYSIHPNGGGETQAAIDAKEGDVLLFPSRLVHWVEPTHKCRATISFNLCPAF